MPMTLGFIYRSTASLKPLGAQAESLWTDGDVLRRRSGWCELAATIEMATEPSLLPLSTI